LGDLSINNDDNDEENEDNEQCESMTCRKLGSFALENEGDDQFGGNTRQKPSSCTHKKWGWPLTWKQQSSKPSSCAPKNDSFDEQGSNTRKKPSSSTLVQGSSSRRNNVIKITNLQLRFKSSNIRIRNNLRELL